jgi:hypothetical protein
MSQPFEPGTSYPIETLPDDLHDDKPAGQKWAIRDALFWNDCQGWWLDHISDVRRDMDWLGKSVARFWQPLPPNPMTREQILTERGMVVCAGCDHAIDPAKPHICRSTYAAPDTDAA